MTSPGKEDGSSPEYFKKVGGAIRPLQESLRLSSLDKPEIRTFVDDAIKSATIDGKINIPDLDPLVADLALAYQAVLKAAQNRRRGSTSATGDLLYTGHKLGS